MTHSADKDALVVGANVIVGSLRATGTVTKIDRLGVHVRLHRAVNGTQRCCASVSECSVVTRVIPPAKRLREQARERGIKPVGTDVDIETGKRFAPEDTRPLPPGSTEEQS
jgi:hypothetical protein